MLNWDLFFNDFAQEYYSVFDHTNKKHIYALQNYLLEQNMLLEDVDYAIKTLLGEEVPINSWSSRGVHRKEESDRVAEEEKPTYAKAPGGKFYVKHKTSGNVYAVVTPNAEKHDPISREKAEKEVETDDDYGLPSIDVDNIDHQTAREEVYPEIEKAGERVEKLLQGGKKKEAQGLVKALVKKYKLSRPLYLQPDKKGLGKIYVGDKHRYAWGDSGKAPNTAQGKLIDMIEKSGATIPVRPGGISRTALSPQQVHRKRKVGNVKTNMEDGKVVSKEVSIGDRSFVLKANPNDPLSQMKLDTLPDGEVEFCDINSADTPEGRTECVMNATNNLAEMFTTIENNISEEDEFNRGIAQKVKKGLLELQKLENDKNKAESDEEKEQLQTEFYNKSLDILAETKATNPDGKNEWTNMTAYAAETVEAIIDLNKGIETYIPASGNFETSDVLSLEGGSVKSTAVTVDGRKPIDEYEIKGTSVKFAGGGASQMPNKIDNSTFKDKDTEIEVGGKKRKGTKQILNGLTEYYGNLFPEEDEAPKPFKEEELKKMMDDNMEALFQYYPEFRDNEDVMKEILDRCENASQKQLDRLNRSLMDEKGEGYENALERFKLYHFNQWTTGMVHNHSERGLQSQAFSNSDYVVGSKEGKKYVKRVHSDGVDSLVYVGFDPDQGYRLSKSGKITPTNVYSSRMKHNNPADYWTKKIK
jgi:hypothetical protein